MSITEIENELNKLNKGSILYLFTNLLNNNKINFSDLNVCYVNYLEQMKEVAISKESLFSSCLASYIEGLAQRDNEEEFFQSQAFVLLEKWLPNEWIDKNLNKRTDEFIIKNKTLIEVE